MVWVTIKGKKTNAEDYNTVVKLIGNRYKEIYHAVCVSDPKTYDRRIYVRRGVGRKYLPVSRERYAEEITNFKFKARDSYDRKIREYRLKVYGI